MALKKDMIVTLDGKDRYYLADKIKKNKVNYFLANLLDENKEQTEKSYIFKETIYGEDVYLEEVKDEKTINLIAFEFTKRFIKYVDEMPQKSNSLRERFKKNLASNNFNI